MKIRGIKVDDLIEEKTTIYKCPYCTKKFINKNSYYNHLNRNFCYSFDINLQIKTNQFDNKEITAQEYYEWMLTHGYEYAICISEEEKKEISNELLQKIEDLYSDIEED